MKKYFGLIIVLFISLFLVGCNKSNDKNIKKENESLVKELYSDDKKLVYDNNGAYKVAFYYEGDNVTKVMHIYEYKDDEEAKNEYDSKLSLVKNSNTIDNIYLVNNYVLYKLNESSIDGLTIEQIKDKYSYLVEIEK